MRIKWIKLLAILLVFGLVAAACGDSDDDNADSGSTGTTAAATTDETTAATDAPTTAPPATVSDTQATTTTEAGEVITYGGVITIGLEAEATGLRPWEDACASPCYNIMRSIYDLLFEIDADFQPTPWLAESVVTNDDFTEYVVTLRSGILFHNGVAVSAQTIADMFPIQQEGAVGAGAVAAAGLVSVEATGDLEVTYTLGAGNSAFLAYLTRAPLGMVFEPAEAVADPDGYSINPIGSGPFVIAKRDIDNETTVVRNDEYWQSDRDGNQLPYLDSINFRPIPDEGTRLSSLISGTTNALQTLRQGTIRDARDAGGLILYEFQGNNSGGGMFNVLVPPFDDVRVRKGLTLLNNQDSVIDALGGTGISLPGRQWFSPDSPWYSQEAADGWIDFDIPAGTALLQEYIDDPGRSDGKAAGENIDVELSCPPDPTLVAAMQVLQAVWDSTGLVTTELTAFDQATHINNALGLENGFVGTHQAHCWRWSSDDDPALSLNSAFGAPTPELAEELGIPFSATNFSNYATAELYQLLVDAINTDVFEERYALYEQVSFILNEEVPIWFSGHTATLIATSEGITGFTGWETPDRVLGAGHPASEAR
ncbi:hypothetical protein JYT71_00825, partial [Acidimicrobiaceae bacterium AH-315-P05]|nr:hypothetical protein [Acidimicrobiaceae bacterium AH-315-P05]